MQIQRFSRWLLAFTVATSAILAGCATAPEIPAHARIFDGAPVIVEVLGGGEILVGIDALSNEDWAYFDLDGSEAVFVADPLAESTWDLAFQRFRVKVNGGASGNGDVAVASLGTDDFSLPVDVDSVEWLTDSGSGNRTKYAFTSGGNWYQYRMSSHMLESRREVMLVRSTEGVVYRLQMLTYYDRYLISGYPTFRYAKL